MRTAFVVYNRMTMLDFVGVYDPLTRLRSMGFRSDFEWKICAPTATATDDRGLTVQADSVGEPLDAFDMVIVAGGFVARELQHDAAFIEWLQTAAGAKVKASVCTGSLLLGAAGFLTSRPATSHPSAFEELTQYCGSVLDDRVVDAGDVVTARGVTAGIDLGLHLVARIAGVDVQAKIAKQMDYPHVWKK